MAKRRRSSRTFDNSSGADLSGIMDPVNSADFIRTIVPNDTPIPQDGSVTAVAVDFPEPGKTTWYSPTTAAIVAGRAQAALDTLKATSDKIVAVGTGITENIIPIIIGLAALYWLFKYGER